MIRAFADIELLLHLLRVDDAVLNVVGDLVEDDLRNRLLVRLVVHNFQSSLLGKRLAFDCESTAAYLCAIRPDHFIHAFVVTRKDKADDELDATF